MNDHNEERVSSQSELEPTLTVLKFVSPADFRDLPETAGSAADSSEEDFLFASLMEWQTYRYGDPNDYAGLWEPSDGDILGFWNAVPVGRVSLIDGSWVAFLDGEFPLGDLGEFTCPEAAKCVVEEAVAYKVASGYDIS